MTNKEMYCTYREHTYNIGDLIYLDETSDYDLRDHGKYGKIISFIDFDD